MKKKLLSLMLSIAVVFSFMPFFTLQADAATGGGKYFVKNKTVTIQPGKTYKSRTFKIKKKMAVQVPIKITLAKKNLSDEDYNYTLSYNMTLKAAKGKKKWVYKCKDEGIYNPYDGNMIYENWIYMPSKVVKNKIKKGKYFVTIKNTSKKAIKVTFSVKGYTKIASKAKLKKNITVDNDVIHVYAGKVGPGMPVIKSIKSSNPNIFVGWTMSPDGKLRLFPDADDNGGKTVVTVTLKNKSKKFKINLKVKPEETD